MRRRKAGNWRRPAGSVEIGVEERMRKTVKQSQVVDLTHYEKIRTGFREEVLAVKANRRVMVGEYFHFLFENHITVLYQVQEMMRTERIVEEAAIEHELATYNELIPPAGELGATLMIEYPEREMREKFLPRLLGIERHVWLKVGALPPLAARFDDTQIGEQRISSVQYLIFPLTDAHRGAWLDSARDGNLKLGVDHPHYSAETVIGLEVAQALALDFR